MMNATQAVLPAYERSPLSNTQITLPRPLTASEAYSLGITIGKHIREIYANISRNCGESLVTDVIDGCISRKQVETNILKERFNYALNCEIDRFYQSGGTLIEPDQTQKEIANKDIIINRNLNSFASILENYYDYSQTINDINSFSSLYDAVCKNSTELYKRLAKFYTHDNISRAFEDMANIVAEEAYKVNI